MNFEYYFENVTENSIEMIILPNKEISGDIYMITSWLFGDVHGSDSFLYVFNEYMENPDMDEYELSGNSCELLMNKKFTTIRWNWYDQVPNSCTLPTQMLYEILQIWVAKYKELREEEHKQEENK